MKKIFLLYLLIFTSKEAEITMNLQDENLSSGTGYTVETGLITISGSGTYTLSGYSGRSSDITTSIILKSCSNKYIQFSTCNKNWKKL